MLAGIIFPLVPFVGVIENEFPLQISNGGTVTIAFGLMVTVYVNEGPSQFPVLGITVYVAVCATLVGFVSVPLRVVCPVAAAPPVKPPVTVGAFQL